MVLAAPTDTLPRERGSVVSRACQSLHGPDVRDGIALDDFSDREGCALTRRCLYQSIHKGERVVTVANYRLINPLKTQGTLLCSARQFEGEFGRARVNNCYFHSFYFENEECPIRD